MEDVDYEYIERDQDFITGIASGHVPRNFSNVSAWSTSAGGRINPSGNLTTTEISNEFKTRRHELYVKLMSMVDRAVIQYNVLQEIMLQHSLLELRRPDLVGHKGKIVLMVDGDLIIANTLSEATHIAKDKHGDRPFYSENIDVIEYPTLLD